MVRKLIALALLALALVWLSCSNDNKSTGVDTGSIEGRITANGIGIPGVSIYVSAYLVSEGGAKIDGALDDTGSASDGDYHIDLLPGQYSIQYMVTYNGESLEGSRYPVTVNSGATVTINIDLKNPAPTNLIVIEYGGRVRLQWEGGYGSSSHNIYRSAAEFDDYQQIGNSYYGYGSRTYYDSPPAVRAYKYKVTAVSPSGESVPSNEAQIAFSGAIPAPSNLVVRDQISYVSLAWSFPSGNALQYKVYRSTAQANWSVITTTSSAGYNDIPPALGIYNYRVTAVSSYGVESTPSIVATVNYDGRLDPPQSLTIVDRGSALYLTWATSNQASSYNIYGSQNPNQVFGKIDSTTFTYFQHHPETSGTWYYKISAIGPNGFESDLTDAVSADFDGRLDPPNYLMALDLGLQVRLSWNNVNWAGAYLIYRSADGGSTFNQIARVSTASSYYYDTPLTAGDYYYKISTETYDGVEGLLSSAVMTHFSDNLIAPTNLIAQNDGLSVSLTWNSVTGATGYTVYRATDPGGDYVEIEDATSIPSYINIPSQAGPYYYRVQAFDDHSHRSPMSYFAYVYYTARPLPPYNLNIIDYAYNVNISWYTYGQADSFLVFRAYNANGNYEPKFWTTSINAFDWPPAAGHYYYKVQSFDNGVSSELSDYAHIYFSGILGEPVGLDGYDAGNYVRLNWLDVDGAYNYDVYRGTNTDSMTIIQTAYASEASDTPPAAGTYYYAVVAKTRGGLASPMCPPVAVVFTP
jgi:fibronectin type 3 domain-containing protein